MQKERIAAVFIGALMLFSVAGFALQGSSFTANVASNDHEEYSLEPVVNRYLSSQEKAIILTNGRVIIESVYGSECSECKQMDSELQLFTNNNQGFVFMQSVETESGDGFDKLQMIGSDGSIINLEDEDLTQENILNIFCGLSAVQPKSCILKGYDVE